jgi:hypothetical protein
MALVSRFCVYWSENAIKNVITEAIADGHSSQLLLQWAANPQPIQAATNTIAPRNAHGDPTIFGVRIAIRRSNRMSLIAARRARFQPLTDLLAERSKVPVQMSVAAAVSPRKVVSEAPPEL